MLSSSVKERIRNASPTELFELFFSIELKNYIIEATCSNEYNFTLYDFDVFLGILILSIFNKRKSQRDYWSTNQLLACKPVASAMSRQKFETIKSKIKLSKPKDENLDDKAWRVRGPFEIFKNNIRQFGWFSTALSIDEMMIKFHGKTILKQFIKEKPVRFGIKMWAICSANGFLFDCDIYCGKGSNIYSPDKGAKLSKCALGSRIVVQMVHNLLSSVVPRKIPQYHLYFDNFFSNPDLLVHLRKVGLRATGTVRENRIKVNNKIDKRAKRGSFIVKHERNSGMNYITLMDSKPVSVLSTIAGVTPLSSVKRYSKEEKQKIDIPFPKAFTLYNKFMGGVDLYDAHCSNLMPCIRSKKWTWAILMRLVQSSITNATVLRNLVSNEHTIGTKEMALHIAEYYIEKGTAGDLRLHKIQKVEIKKKCSNAKCATRTQQMCTNYNVHQCLTCFNSFHK